MIPLWVAEGIGVFAAFVAAVATVALFVDWLRHRARRPRTERLPGVPE